MISESVLIPSTIPPGIYDLRLAIEDIDRHLPGIQLAISGKDDSSRYRLSRVEVQSSTVVRESFSSPPRHFSLLAFPNPAHDQTRIEIHFERPAGIGDIELTVHNLRGNLVRRLQLGRIRTTKAQVYWDGLDGQHHPVATGVYFLRLRHESGHMTRKITLLR